MRKFLTLLTAAILVVFTVPSHASDYSDIIDSVMDLIEDEYAGGELTREELYEAALYGISSVLDNYSGYLDEEELNWLMDSLSGQLYGIGVQFHINENNYPEVIRVIKDSPAERGGLKSGDIFTHINGASTRGKTSDDVTQMIQDPEKMDI